MISEHKLACPAVIFFVSCHAVELHQRAFDVLVWDSVFLLSGLGGLCELVQHLIIFDYIPVSESLESKLVIQNAPAAIDYSDRSFFS